MRLFPIIAVILSSIVSGGCISTAAVCSVAVATKGIIDPRSIGLQIDDSILEARVNAVILKDEEIMRNARIIAIVYKSKILFIGQAPNLALAEKAMQIAIKLKNVKAIYNQIRLLNPINFNTVYRDTCITSKIKLQILIKNLVRLLTVKVITENGEVFLLGTLNSEEGSLIARLASETGGVRRVITIFTYTE